MKDGAFRVNEKERLVLHITFRFSRLGSGGSWERISALGAVFTTDLLRESATEYAQYSLGYSILFIVRSIHP